MSDLRTALQFGEVDQLRSQLAVLDQKTRQQKVIENEKRCSQWLVKVFPGEPPLATVAANVLEFARKYSNFHMEMLECMLALGSGWRVEEMPSLAPHHRPVPPREIKPALERFFQWTGDQAFAELHPIEQTALSQARLLEIGPFARLNLPLIRTLTCFWLLRRGFVFPTWEYHQPGKYEEYLDRAFCLEMQELVDHLLRGEREALRVTLAV